MPFDFLHVCVRVNARRQGKDGTEMVLEVVEPRYRPPKLAVQSLPRHRNRRVEAVKPVGKPAIDVERERVVGDLTDRRLLDRHGVLFQFVKKGLRQAGLLDE